MSDEVKSDEKEAVRKQRFYIPKALVLACKKDYLEGKGSIREIAERYNVSSKALSARCTRDNWTLNSERVVEKVIETVERIEASRLERLRVHEEEMILRMQKRLQLVDNTYSQIGELVEPGDLRSLVSTEGVINQVIRRNLGAEEKVALSGSVNVNIVGILEKIRERMRPGVTVDVEAVKEELKGCELIDG